VLSRIGATVSRYGMFAAGARVGVAVSGGADSVCLLHALVELAPQRGLSLAVLHLNHQLRGAESDADEEFVRTLAAGSGLEFVSRTVDVGKAAEETHDNLEQAARRARRAFFLDMLGSGVLDRVALGHTRSDQAETVLFRFLRGSGTAGLAAMRPVTPEGLVRPLIEIGRQEVRDYLLERGIAWREDSSNADLSFARNRIRRHLLPELVRGWNPGLEETLAGMARVAGDEEDYWEAEIERLAAGRLIAAPPAVLFATDWLRSLPRAAARRAVRKAIAMAKADLRSVDLRHIEQIMELVSSSEGSGRLQIPGLDVFRSFDQVRLAPPGIDTLEGRNYEIAAPVPGRVALPRLARVLELEIVEKCKVSGTTDGPAYVYNEGEGSDLDWGRVSGELRVRNWRPGDQYRPVGHARETKIKTLFQEARIPLWERRSWPVLTCGEVILWAAGFGPAAEFAAGPRTDAVLKVRELAESTEL
jgi:tRNA(Ile)-lysidine synthase